ncbi:MAG: DUF4011 domain-containing protein, partial [Ruminococcaceae bacterium]|nr:DUF4011 domain-containing protein [Oscillospiraceae bacterium]
MREPIRLESTILPVVNYALQQNRMPVIQTLSIINNTDKPLEKINIKITATPELCLPWTKPVDFVPANSVYDIKDVRIILNAAFLAGLTEKVTGLLRLALVCEDTVLFTDTREMTVLAYDAWHGYAYYPELLTSFVMPNHPEIARINAEASRILGAWTGDPSLDAYQSQDPDRVLSQAAAVYAALQKQNIVYAVHPASFEKVGQRIRLCDAVLQSKMGTCLDLALLYASCLEAIGLHSILILKRDHIISGVWLEDLSFPESVQDDASLITKRLASGVREIAVVETTLLVAGKRVSFDEARAVAEQELAGQNPVEYIIDVTRARLSGITPLPMRIQTENGWTIERKTLHDSALTPGPKDYGKTIRVDVASGEDKFSKKIQWERKLLDLGLRNTLINMRLSRTMIPLLASSLDDLEDALADGSDFTMLPRPVDWQVSADGIDFETMHVLSGYENLIKSEFKNRRLRSAYTEMELTRTVKALYRSYKAALEENGANTLYLALGLLRWYEMAKSTKPRYAPLILIPVDMVRKSASQGYVIRLRDDEPQMNITLLEMLKQNFSITVGGLDPLPQDEHGIDSRRAFTIFRQAIMGQARWDVLESAYLGIFSFSQFVMWNDIRNRSDDLERNKIVRSLIDGKLAWAANNMAIGRRVSEDHAFLPLPADASQLFAIEQACKGESYVLHGPPGTGKSQTITALIANALAQGKTVLFVAEKMAALEVVEKRLDKIGLGTFCLELHSNKAKKRDVLEQLRLATEVTKFTAAEAYAQKATQIAALRQDLDRYAHALHKPQKCGRTLYQLINQYEGYHEAAEIPAFPFAFADTATGALLEQQEAVIERLVVAGKEIGHPHNHPLQAIGCTLYSQQIRTALPGAVAHFRTAVQAIDAAGHALALAIGEPLPSRFDDLGRIAFIANELVVWLDLPRAWAASSNINRYLVDVSDMARHYIKANEWYAQLFPHWTSDFFQLEGNRLFAEHQEASGKWFLGKMLAMNKLEKQVAGYAKNKLEKSALGQQLSVLAAYQAEKSAADALFGTYGNDLEHLYQGADTDWHKIIRLAMGAKESAEKIENLCGSDHVRLNHGGNKKHSSRIQALNAAWADLFPAKQALYALLDITEYTGSAWAQHQEELCINMLT